MPVPELLDQAPVSRRHWCITLVIVLGLFFDIFDVSRAGVLSTVLTKSFGLSQATRPAVLGSSFLGMFLGAMFTFSRGRYSPPPLGSAPLDLHMG
ncbi:MAG: hypothetical protein JOY54_11610 [Acidobacteriaceae bacterium]|nr:hypothetical protein [Acidobacteriaceae bacterium]